TWERNIAFLVGAGVPQVEAAGLLSRNGGDPQRALLHYTEVTKEIERRKQEKIKREQEQARKNERLARERQEVARKSRSRHAESTRRMMEQINFGYHIFCGLFFFALLIQNTQLPSTSSAQLL